MPWHGRQWHNKPKHGVTWHGILYPDTWTGLADTAWSAAWHGAVCQGNARIMPWPVLYSALQCSTGENGARCRSLTCTHTSAPVEEVEEKVYEVQDAQKNLEEDEEEEEEGIITFILGSLPRMTL